MHLKGRRKKIEVFDVVNTAILIVVLLVIMYPLYFVVIASISDRRLSTRAWLRSCRKGSRWKATNGFCRRHRFGAVT